ncbi:acyltransferase [Mesobacillus maritimus]|uniref:Acyltransferase n=1 Tax=Mesobacillus maritimus TaxID=1643336 RepID=A0ABS7K4T0_9BACI|nr:acyltransferase [Mesobacillus maritimus]MBY0097278.1 acyltransferase [Mesobacillus maritimus]
MNRNYAVDFIKFFAILAVVIIHTFPVDTKFGYFMLDNLSRFAVPYFFAASGYLFGIKVINNPTSYTYFKKYVIKIVKIYASWFLFYFLYDVLRIVLAGGNVRAELSKYLGQFTPLDLVYYGQGTSGYQLWFVIALVWSVSVLYLFFRMNKITLLLIAALCFNLLGLFGQSYSIFYELTVRTTRDAFFIGLFYTTLGFWFAHASPFKQYRDVSMKTSLYLFCFFLVLQVAEGYFLEKGLDAKHGEYFLSTIFLTVFLFSLTIQHPQLGKGLWISKIGGNALGIYAIHVLFIDLVDLAVNTLGLKNIGHFLIWNMTDTFLVFTLSYLSYRYIQKFKKGMLV